MPSALLYVGCCNRPLGYVKNFAGKGISAFRLDPESGATEALGITEGIDNPTFLEVARDGQLGSLRGWHRLGVQVLQQHLHRRVCFEHELSGEQVVGDAAERIDDGAPIHVGSPENRFGRHVGRRPGCRVVRHR